MITSLSGIRVDKNASLLTNAVLKQITNNLVFQVITLIITVFLRSQSQKHLVFVDAFCGEILILSHSCC